MKKELLVCLFILLLCMICIPLIAIHPDADGWDSSMTNGASSGMSSGEPVSGEEVFKLLITSTGEVAEVPEEEYVLGVVAAEIGTSFPEEAIKAQAVAAYTFALYRKGEQRSTADPGLKGADLTDDPLLDQSYISVDQMKEKWGDNFDANYNQLKTLVEEVEKQVVVYEDQPVLAAYHAISGGRTESSTVIWDVERSYLTPVESVGDLLAEGYMTTVEYTVEEFIDRAASLSVELSADDAASFADMEPERSESGTVTKYRLGGQELKGTDMRKAFDLRSANFDVALTEENNLKFTVRGYGHGVGMSQYGARYMAEQGSAYNEILLWYYSGCQIKKIT